MKINPRFQEYKFNTKKKKKSYSLLWRLCKFYILLVILRALLVYGIAYPVIIRSSQMEPSLQILDRVVVSPLFGLITRQAIRNNKHEMVRGQIVQVVMHDTLAFRSLLDGAIDIVSFGFVDIQFSEIQLRRIIAFEGERVALSGYIALLTQETSDARINEFRLVPHAYETVRTGQEKHDIDMPFLGSMKEIRVPEGQVFVLADNRVQGIDSRYWESIPIEALRSRVMARYWPFYQRRLY